VLVIISFNLGVSGSHGGSAIPRLGGTEKGRDDPRGWRGEQSHRAVPCELVSSSRVLAKGEVSSKVPAKRGSTVPGTEPEGGRRKDREWASHKQQMGHSKGLWDHNETRTRP